MLNSRAKWQKLAPWSIVLASTLPLIACGRGSNKDDKQSPTDEGNDQNQPNNSSSANAIRISGQLNIAALDLVAGAKSIYAFTARSGNIGGDPKSVEVAADGTFSTELVKTEDSIQNLANELAKPRDQRDWEGIVRSAKSSLPDAENITVEMLKGMSEADLKAGVADEISKMKKSGPVTVLVAYDKTGDRVSEAQSFRFISLPTPSGKALSSLPNERLKGNLDLGKISGSKRDVTSEAKSTDAIDLSASALDSMADMGRALKNLTNSYMNASWKSQPFYFWTTTDKYTDVLNKFSNPANSSYKGYGFYIGSLDDQGLTYADVCGAKAITFTPPAPVTTVDSQGSSSTQVEYINTGVTPRNQGSNRVCEGNGYYAREDVNNGRTTYMLNFGTGGSITSSPKGLWRLKVDNREVGRFDFDLASPIVDGKPTALIPSAKFVTSGGQVTGVEVELYRWAGTQYEKVSDLGGFRRLVSEMSASITRHSDTKEIMARLKIGDDDKITAAFDGSERDFQGGIANPTVPSSDIDSLAVYYVVANASYRIEFRN